MFNGKHSFKKQERIVSQKLIDELFLSGKSHSLAAFPLRAVFMYIERQEGAQPIQVLMSVPKKRFKHAVDRNRVKRQLREAYRHHRDILLNHIPDDKSIALAFIWLSDAHVPSAVVEKRVVSLLKRIPTPYPSPMEED